MSLPVPSVHQKSHQSEPSKMSLSVPVHQTSQPSEREPSGLSLSVPSLHQKSQPSEREPSEREPSEREPSGLSLSAPSLHSLLAVSTPDNAGLARFNASARKIQQAFRTTRFFRKLREALTKHRLYSTRDRNSAHDKDSAQCSVKSTRKRRNPEEITGSVAEAQRLLNPSPSIPGLFEDVPAQTHRGTFFYGHLGEYTTPKGDVYNFYKAAKMGNFSYVVRLNLDTKKCRRIIYCVGTLEAPDKACKTLMGILTERKTSYHHENVALTASKHPNLLTDGKALYPSKDPFSLEAARLFSELVSTIQEPEKQMEASASDVSDASDSEEEDPEVTPVKKRKTTDYSVFQKGLMARVNTPPGLSGQAAFQHRNSVISGVRVSLSSVPSRHDDSLV